MDLFHLYRDDYFYFNDAHELAKFLVEIKTALSGNGQGGISGMIQELEQMMDHVFNDKAKVGRIDVVHNRIRGDHLQFLAFLKVGSRR
jgi:hypothetical protein